MISFELARLCPAEVASELPGPWPSRRNRRPRETRPGDAAGTLRDGLGAPKYLEILAGCNYDYL